MPRVRRPTDDELCGHVEQCDGQWRALVVFGSLLGIHSTREAAEQHLLDEGLASLAERWTLRRGESEDEEVVCIQEANPTTVTVARGYYSMPGVPTLTITAQQLASGEWVMRR